MIVSLLPVSVLDRSETILTGQKKMTMRGG